MVTKRVRCPHCASLRTKERQTKYGCRDCGKRFQLERQRTKVISAIWNAHTQKKQTLQELSGAYKRSHVWVRK